VETLNPISAEMAALRPSLLPGMLQVLAHNLNHGQAGLRMFETGVVMDRFDEPNAPVPGYRERSSLLLAISGRAVEPGWDARERRADVFDLRGQVESLLDGLGVSGLSFEPHGRTTELTRYHVVIRLAGRSVGVIGAVADSVLERFDVRSDVFFAELDLGALARWIDARGRTRYTDVTRYPVVDRDIAVLVDAAAPVGPMLDTIREIGGPLLRRADVFDLYRDEKLGVDRKSVAFSMRFGADRTLRDQEVDQAVALVTATLEERHGAVLRS